MAHGNDFLVQACLYFPAAVAAVMISHRLRLEALPGAPHHRAGARHASHVRAARPGRADTETFDVEVVAKLYEVHRNRPDKHVTVSNELRDQLARTLSEDQRRMAVAKPQQS
ncbi:MAG TPA: hypothetical protein VJN20_05485 [Burkholderiales bacterium]|nr:hypothetical protein [Burkholderiales bacterium]